MHKEHFISEAHSNSHVRHVPAAPPLFRLVEGLTTRQQAEFREVVLAEFPEQQELYMDGVAASQPRYAKKGMLETTILSNGKQIAHKYYFFS